MTIEEALLKLLTEAPAFVVVAVLWYLSGRQWQTMLAEHLRDDAAGKKELAAALRDHDEQIARVLDRVDSPAR